ncbi:MAG: hypothetical protein JYX80_10695 [Candidatus Scalindua sediminis]|nr:hypothetical protein [Candidatus Scalindua sediminis]
MPADLPLDNEGELVISGSKTEEVLSGEDIRIVLIKGDVIHIYLSESISVRREKIDCCLINNT